MKTQRSIPFSPPDITQAEIDAVGEALRSGWVTTGPRAKQFEKEIAAYCGTERAVCLNSATACMELTLRLFGIGPGDEVITSSYTYTASASVIAHVGAEIVLVDTAPGSLEMDYDALAAAITPRTKAVIPVDVAGVVCDYDRVRSIAEEKKAWFRPANELQKQLGRMLVLADAAHSFGACREGKRSGALADFTSFSFHAVKNLTTAEGGAVTWRQDLGLDQERIYKQYQLMSLHGQNKDALAKTKAGAWEYDIVVPWYKCNMTDIMAALGQAQLKRYPELLARRRELIARYDRAMDAMGVEHLLHSGPNHQGSGHLYMIRVPGIPLERRNEVIAEMGERGIACNVHYKPLPMMTAYRSLGFEIRNYPNAYQYFENEITLPLHTCLTDEDVDYVTEQLGDILRQD